MKRESFGRYLFAGLLVILFGVLPKISNGQATTGSIQGEVTDPKDAVVAGAQITIINQETGATRELVSGDLGQYEALRLPPGRYEVKITKSGFRPFDARDVIVAVAVATPLNVKLEVGGSLRDGNRGECRGPVGRNEHGPNDE